MENREPLEDMALIAEVASKPQVLTQAQEINICYWDKFVEDIGVQLQADKEVYRIYNPKDAPKKD